MIASNYVAVAGSFCTCCHRVYAVIVTIVVVVIITFCQRLLFFIVDVVSLFEHLLQAALYTLAMVQNNVRSDH